MEVFRVESLDQKPFVIGVGPEAVFWFDDSRPQDVVLECHEFPLQHLSAIERRKTVLRGADTGEVKIVTHGFQLTHRTASNSPLFLAASKQERENIVRAIHTHASRPRGPGGAAAVRSLRFQNALLKEALKASRALTAREQDQCFRIALLESLLESAEDQLLDRLPLAEEEQPDKTGNKPRRRKKPVTPNEEHVRGIASPDAQHVKSRHKIEQFTKTEFGRSTQEEMLRFKRGLLREQLDRSWGQLEQS